MTKHKIVSDNDGHSYACPVDKVDEFYNVVEAIDNYWRADSPMHPAPEIPDYCVSIEGDFEFYLEDKNG